jgi:hypothetical protein
MTDPPNFVLIPDPDPNAGERNRQAIGFAGRLRSLAASITPYLQHRVRVLAASSWGTPAAAASPRARLVFGFDATASREPAWATARQVTDALVRALPGALDVALAVHGGSRLHTFTEFTANPNTLRDRAAGITCIAGHTRLLPILSRSLSSAGVRVITYIGDTIPSIGPRAETRSSSSISRAGQAAAFYHSTLALPSACVSSLPRSPYSLWAVWSCCETRATTCPAQ